MHIENHWKFEGRREQCLRRLRLAALRRVDQRAGTGNRNDFKFVRDMPWTVTVTIGNGKKKNSRWENITLWLFDVGRERGKRQKTIVCGWQWGMLKGLVYFRVRLLEFKSWTCWNLKVPRAFPGGFSLASWKCSLGKRSERKKIDFSSVLDLTMKT